MTEDNTFTEGNTMQEFGSHVGQVNRFFNRKGYGFIKDLNDDTDYFKQLEYLEELIDKTVYMIGVCSAEEG